MMTGYKLNGEDVTYNITEDGYDINLGGKPWIGQHEPYIPYPSLGYEGSCLKQLEELMAPTVDTKPIEDRLSALEESQDAQDGAIGDLADMMGGE